MVGKVKVEVFGSEPPCAKCRATVKAVKEASKEFGGAVEVSELSALSPEAERYDVMLTPTVVVNGKVVASGRVPAKEEIARAIRRELEG